MFYIEKNNKKIGQYLNLLIAKSRYPNVRQFCIAYLKLAELETSDEAIGKMQNRMSQIIKGNKAIQTYDLPYFCELLGVSCEEILSAGKHYVPISGHITNYEIAFSKDTKVWDKYINREDKLFLNPDEYNKTVIDYALDFKNYDFLKYLMDNKYIWFVDDSEHDCHEYVFGFGAGTSIKQREIGCQDSLGSILQYHCEERRLRQQMIALAMENDDFDMLTSLRAREIPALYKLCTYMNPQINCGDYYNENVIEEILKSSDKVLDYFSDEFPIKDQFGYEHWFIYPFLSNVLDRLIANKSKYAEVLLRKSIDHNNKVLSRLKNMVEEAFEISKNSFNYSDRYKAPVETVAASAMDYFRFNADDSFVSYFYSRGRGKDCPRFCANIIYLHAASDDLLLDHLIHELNESYDAVRNIQPDTTNY